MKALVALSRSEGVTTFMTLLAVFDTLLHRYTGQDDIVVGSPIAGRGRPEVEGLIGFFVNTLILRTQLGDALPFRALLGRVKEVCLGAYAHQDVSFERLVQELAPQRDRSRSPIFQVLISLQNAPVEQMHLAGLARRGVGVDTSTSKYDLTLMLGEGPRGLRVSLEYASDLFDASTIQRMLAHFRTLLEGIAASPDAPLWQLPLMGEEERSTLLVAWNETAADYPRDLPAHALFEAQAARTPDAVAVIAGDHRLTYRELDARANQLAHWLRGLGAGPDVLVGLCLERTLELPVGILGILKAGGAYVPLDPTYPVERLAWMLEDSAVAIVVTQQKLADELPAVAMPVCLDTDWEQIGAGSETRPEVALTPSSLAYIIYTSGSTGRPKGVMIHHRALVNYLSWASLAYPITAGRGAPVHSSIAFDLTVTSLFCPLITGRTAVMLPDESDVTALVDTLANQGGYGLVKLTPAHLELLNQLVPSGKAAAATRAFVIGGEALSWETLAFWRKNAPGIRLINEYGPTETVVGCCVYDAARPGTFTGPVPIGRPIANTRLYVLDAHLAPVPIGVAGELYIGGDGVARGYLNRPELTAERFVQDPFHAGGRLYRTGDLVRYREGGDLVFLGRIDHQVKIRGYRIELGEIEAVLAQHPGVREAVALAREDTPGDRRLAAYIVAVEAPAPDAAELRRFLGARLPEYMVPSAFVVLDALPLTPNGKVDRKALPAPDARSGLTGEVVGPRNPIEEVLAGIWADLLGVEGISVHSDFFELGGHSLLATQVGARIATFFQVQLPLQALFEATTIAELGARIAAAMEDGGGLLVLPIVKAPQAEPPVLSFAQERLWFLQQLEPDDTSYNVPLAVRFGGALDVAALGRALTEVVRRHEVLRTTYAVRGEETVALIQAEAELPMPLTSLAALPEAEREPAARREMEAELRRPFDLAAGLPIRARLFALGERDHVLFVAMHHIATDGWSVAVLGRELGALYEAFSRGLPSPLAELAVQYADYAAWQRAWLSGAPLAKQLIYWKERLGSAPRVLYLPTDRPRPPALSHRGSLRSFSVDAETSRAIAQLCQREGVTLFMALLAAFDVLLYRWSGQADLVVGTPIAGRTRTETEGLIGLFVNTLAMRATLEDELTFRALLARTREGCLGAYAHQDMPFERLVAELDSERDMSRTPLFQVLFALQNAPPEQTTATPASTPPALRRRGMALDGGTAKFDLTFALREGPRGISGVMEYATDLFDGATIERMLVGFRALLADIAKRPDARVWELAVLPEDERRRLVAAATPAREYGAPACLHALFEAQVDRVPDAMAVTFEKSALSYGELDARANRVAHALRKRGVGPGTLVGLGVERSLEMLVGLLGILKAGGAYLPLDPEYPKDRIAFMLEDSRARVVLTQARFAELFSAHGADVLRLDSDWPSIAEEPTFRPASGARPEDLAYVIYTSGSTGKPKGVMVEHRNVARLFAATEVWYGFDARDVWTMFHSCAFDFSVWEIWGALLHGGRVVIVPYWVSRSPEAFYQLLVEERVTVLNQTPSAFRELVRTENDVDEATRASLSLRYVIFGGEALDLGDLRPFWDRHGDQEPRLINMYGITETTVHVTYRPVSRADLDKPWSSVIGEPIPDLGLAILDAHRQPSPVGVPGAGRLTMR